MKPFKRLAVWGLVGGLLVLAACASAPEPFTYTSENEFKSGPGLFSGDDGVFTIYGKPPGEPGTVKNNGGKADASGPSEPAAH